MLAMCWDTDVEGAVLSLTRDKVEDQSYWSSTVSRVEDGIDPETNQKITMGGLEAWVKRCKTQPMSTKEATAHENKTRSVSPSNRCVPYP